MLVIWKQIRLAFVFRDMIHMQVFIEISFWFVPDFIFF